MGQLKRDMIVTEERRHAARHAQHQTETGGATTLGDITGRKIDVFCWCNRCAHNAILESRHLLPQLGPAYPVPEIGARMRCSSCGSKDIATRPAWPSLGPVARHS